MKRHLSFVIIMALCLPVFTVHGQQEQLTPDQKYELEQWQKSGHTGEPPFFKQKFIIPSGKGVESLIEGNWSVIFTHDVTAENVEDIALALAKKYEMKVRAESVSKGKYARMAFFTGPTDAAKRLSADPQVRNVTQDAYIKSHIPGEERQPFELKDGKRINEKKNDGAEDLKLTLPPPVKKKRPSGDLWDESVYDAFGVPQRSEFRYKDVVKPEDMDAFKRLQSSGQSLLAEPSDSRYPVGYSLDRIDVRSRSYNQTYRSRHSGTGVDIYIVDSGLAPHVEFEDVANPNVQRIVHFRSAWQDGYLWSTGHGTAVASQAGGKTYGAANGATLISVRVLHPILTCPENLLVQFLQDVRNRAGLSSKNSVVNISFTRYPSTPALVSAVNDLVADGIFVTGACDYSFDGTIINRSDYWPGIVSSVVLTGMNTNLDRRWSFGSNFANYQYLCQPGTPNYTCLSVPYHGTGADIFAMGAPATLADNYTLFTLGPEVALAGSYYGFSESDGTSFSAPLVAGVAATFIGYQNLTDKIKYNTIRDAIIKNATTGQIVGTGGAPNRLLYSYFGMSAVRHSASYRSRLAPDTFGSGFNAFETGAVVARLLNPDTGVIYGLGIIANISGQINFITPGGIPSGTYSVEYLDGAGALVGYGAIGIDSVAPGVFSLDTSGTGIANGQLLLVEKANPSNQTYIALSAAGNSWNSATHDAYMILYGSGWRHNNGTNAVQIKKDSTIWDSASNFGLLYVGAVGGDPALDQINIGPLPSSLIGKGTCDIKVYINGTPGQSSAVLANITQVKFN